MNCELPIRTMACFALPPLRLSLGLQHVPRMVDAMKHLRGTELDFLHEAIADLRLRAQQVCGLECARAVPPLYPVLATRCRPARSSAIQGSAILPHSAHAHTRTNRPEACEYGQGPERDLTTEGPAH